MSETATPEVSVVIPTYNGAATIERVLDALGGEAGAGVNFEVIVVDDGSTDGTGRRVQAWVERNAGTPMMLLGQENRGPATARNLGVASAAGELVLLLGDDTIPTGRYLETMVEAFRQAGTGDVGVVGLTRYSEASIPTSFGRWLAERSGIQFAYRGLRPGQALEFAHLYGSSTLLPRGWLLRVNGFDEGFRAAAMEDTELGYRLFQDGFSLVYCPGSVTLHEHGVTVRGTIRRLQSVAVATRDLRRLNPAAYRALYPQGDVLFARPGALRQVGRWLLAAPGGRLLAWLDGIGVPLPGGIYERTMAAVHRRAVSAVMDPS